MKSSAEMVEEYIASLPEDRREAVTKVREVILANLPKGYQEAMNWGMIAYEVPLDAYPDTYNKKPLMYAALGSQKNYMAVYVMCAYGSPELKEQFETDYLATGKKLDMGKSCIRFKKLDDLALDVIGEFIGKVPMDNYIAAAKSVERK